MCPKILFSAKFHNILAFPAVFFYSYTIVYVSFGFVFFLVSLTAMCCPARITLFGNITFCFFFLNVYIEIETLSSSYINVVFVYHLLCIFMRQHCPIGVSHLFINQTFCIIPLLFLSVFRTKTQENERIALWTRERWTKTFPLLCTQHDVSLESGRASERAYKSFRQWLTFECDSILTYKCTCRSMDDNNARWKLMKT